MNTTKEYFLAIKVKDRNEAEVLHKTLFQFPMCDPFQSMKEFYLVKNIFPTHLCLVFSTYRHTFVLNDILYRDEIYIVKEQSNYENAIYLHAFIFICFLQENSEISMKDFMKTFFDIKLNRPGGENLLHKTNVSINRTVMSIPATYKQIDIDFDEYKKYFTEIKEKKYISPVKEKIIISNEDDLIFTKNSVKHKSMNNLYKELNRSSKAFNILSVGLEDKLKENDAYQYKFVPVCFDCDGDCDNCDSRKICKKFYCSNCSFVNECE